MALSDSKLRNIKAPYLGKPELADRDGLTVRITKSAIVSFNYRFRWRGKQQRIKIGRYPDVLLSETKLKAGEYRQVLLEGVEPKSNIDNNKIGRLLSESCEDFINIYGKIQFSTLNSVVCILIGCWLFDFNLF